MNSLNSSREGEKRKEKEKKRKDSTCEQTLKRGAAG
jgi:hypothetical protein